MQSQHVARSLTVGLLGIMLALLPLLGSAAPRFVEIIEPREGIGVIDGVCDFPLQFEEHGELRIREFYDNAGELSMVKIDGPVATTTFTNLETGFAVTSPVSPLTIQIAPDRETIIGLPFRLNVPGSGLVALDAGRITFTVDGNVIIQGPHEVFEQGFPSAEVCAAFARAPGTT